MLDFGFSEILLTSAIALVVLGPERLPKVARQVGNWMGRARLMARQLSEQLEREVNAEELLRAQLKLNEPPAGKTSSPAIGPPPVAPQAPEATMGGPDAAAAPNPFDVTTPDAMHGLDPKLTTPEAMHRFDPKATTPEAMHPAAAPPPVADPKHTVQ